MTERTFVDETVWKKNNSEEVKDKAGSTPQIQQTCGANFSEKKLSMEKGDSFSLVMCGKCDWQFVDKDGMWKHYQTCHQPQKPSLTDSL